MLKPRKLLVLVHRYLGTALCLLFFMWFLTGIGMIYSRGMPRLTAQVRLARLPVLDMERIRLSPSEAVQRAELGIVPSRARLLTVMDRPAYRFNAGGQVTLFAEFPSIDAPSWKALFGERAIKEVEFARIQGDPYFVIRSSSDEAPLLGAPDGGHQPYFVSRNRDAERLVVAANPLAIRTAGFSTGSITGSLKKALPDVPILETELLADYDSYYYSRDREVPLPVLRVKFGDPARTWVYIDPEVNQIVGQVQRNNRIERWLYNGLHSLDFSFWYYKRPLWDIGVILLSLGGAALSGMGVLMGFRRIMRAVTRTVRSPAAERATSPVPGLR